MKKFKLIYVFIFIFLGVLVYLNYNSYDLSIETYIDGKLAAAMPNSTDGYIVDEITCSTGSATFNYSSWKLEIGNLTGDTTCTVSFKSNDNYNYLSKYLISEDMICAGFPQSDSDAKDCLVFEQEAFRYQGIDPNNYILFNNELWRVIGVFNVENSNGQKQYLTKILKYDILDVLAFDNNMSSNWINSSLQQTLNNAYYNSKDAKCYTYTDTDALEKVSKTCRFSKTGLNHNSRSMVESVVWNISGIVTSKGNRNIENIYEQERNGSTYDGYSSTWLGKIGLINPSDYGYSMLASSCSRDTLIADFAKQECAGNSWIFSGDQYTINPNLSSTKSLYYLDDDGYVSTSYANQGDSTYPALYLKENVKYVSGTGTYNDPFIIM